MFLTNEVRSGRGANRLKIAQGRETTLTKKHTNWSTTIKACTSLGQGQATCPRGATTPSATTSGSRRSPRPMQPRDAPPHRPGGRPAPFSHTTRGSAHCTHKRAEEKSAWEGASGVERRPRLPPCWKPGTRPWSPPRPTDVESRESVVAASIRCVPLFRPSPNYVESSPRRSR